MGLWVVDLEEFQSLKLDASGNVEGALNIRTDVDVSPRRLARWRSFNKWIGYDVTPETPLMNRLLIKADGPVSDGDAETLSKIIEDVLQSIVRYDTHAQIRIVGFGYISDEVYFTLPDYIKKLAIPRDATVAFQKKRWRGMYIYPPIALVNKYDGRIKRIVESYGATVFHTEHFVDGEKIHAYSVNMKGMGQWALMSMLLQGLDTMNYRCGMPYAYEGQPKWAESYQRMYTQMTGKEVELSLDKIIERKDIALAAESADSNTALSTPLEMRVEGPENEEGDD